MTILEQLVIRFDQEFVVEEVLTVSQFKAKCLEVFDRLNRHELQKVTVTRRGKTIAIVTSPSSREEEAAAVHGSMAGMVIIPADFDLTAPVFDEQLNAEHGRVEQ